MGTASATCAGSRERLDYLAWLGVDAFWLSPFYPSPLADFGYDIADYTAVDPQLGTLGDFDALVAAAHERGLRVLLDLDSGTHVDRAPLVPRASGLVHLVAGRRAAEQLGLGLRRARVGPRRAQRTLVPALVLSGAGRPRLAQPGGGGGDAGRRPLLARARRGRVPRRRDRPDGQGRRAARRAAGDERVPVSAPPGRGRAGAPVLGQPARGRGRASVDQGGSRRCAPGRRGLRADVGVPALPGGARSRLLVRVPLLALGRRSGCARRSSRRRSSAASPG